MISRILSVALVSVLAGCASEQTAGRVVVSDGCLIVVEGISTDQANSIVKDWNIDKNCEIQVKTEATENK